MRKLVKLFSVITIGLMFVAGTAYGADEFMTLTGQTSQPIGHYEFCQRNKDLCSIHNKNIKPVKLTQKKWELIQSINQSVNARIRPATDMEIYGQEEYWAYPVDAGDCEDYVLQKQLELNQKGFPLSSLLITVVRKPNGEGHAVLTVRTTSGDLVLDNLRDEIYVWKDTEYTYLKRQSEEYTGYWIGIAQHDNIVVSSVDKPN